MFDMSLNSINFRFKRFHISSKITVCICIIAMFLLFFSGPVSAKELQVGVSPLMLDLGTLKKGESVVGSFFIVTSSQDEIVVRLKSTRSNFDFFKKPENLKIVNYVSEEDSSKWVFFPENPYVLEPTDDVLNTKAGTISDWKRVNFVLNVPDDAEPCNHAFKIEPTPYAAKEDGNSVNIIAMVAITVKFIVEGGCEVSGDILDIMQDTSSNYVDLNVYFKNAGTATVSAFSPDVQLFYENGTLLDETMSGTVYTTPGDISVLKARFNANKVLPGNYLVNASVIYGANTTAKQVPIIIEKPEIINIVTTGSTTSVGEKSNIYLLFILILIVAYLIYKREDKR